MHLKIVSRSRQPSIRVFTSLRDLRLDCIENGGEFTSHDLEEALNDLSLKDHQLHNLDIRDLTWPDFSCMGLLALHFPFLRTLKMAQRTIWCSMCNTCSHVSFDAQTDQSLIYEKGYGLPVKQNTLNLPDKWLTLSSIVYVRSAARFYELPSYSNYRMPVLHGCYTTPTIR